MCKIDLHGVRHKDVSRKLDIFFWEMMKKNISEVEVVTGISEQMKKIVIKTSKDYDFNIVENFNEGSLKINLI